MNASLSTCWAPGTSSGKPSSRPYIRTSSFSTTGPVSGSRGKDHSVLLDPQRQFGSPHIKGTGNRTDVIAQMEGAEGGGPAAIAAAADWFGLGREQVADAVNFEGRWLLERPD